MLMNRIQRGAGKGKEESKQIPRALGLNQYITCGVISQLKWEKQGEKEVWKEERTREARITNVVFNVFHLPYLLDNEWPVSAVYSALCFLTHQPKITRSVTFCFCSALNFYIAYFPLQNYVRFLFCRCCCSLLHPSRDYKC